MTAQALSEAPEPISRATVSSLRRKAGELAAVAILAATPDPAHSMEMLLKAGQMATAPTPNLQQRLDRSSKDFREERDKRTLLWKSDLDEALDEALAPIKKKLEGIDTKFALTAATGPVAMMLFGREGKELDAKSRELDAKSRELDAEARLLKEQNIRT